MSVTTVWSVLLLVVLGLNSLLSIWNVDQGASHTVYRVGGRLVALRQNGQLRYVHTDHLGSVGLLTDEDGQAVPGSVQRFFPFGKTRTGQPVILPTGRNFTGQQLDVNTGLLYYGSQGYGRYYDPALARFVQPDILIPNPGDPQQLNRYSYARNNPLKYQDPSGHWFETAWDILNIGWDIYEIKKDPSLVNIGALVVDVAAAALPFVPGGVGMIVRGGKAAKAVVSHTDEAVDMVRLGSRASDFAKVAHLRGADKLLSKLLSTSTKTVKGAEFELEFALKHTDDIEEMGKVLEVIQGGNKEIDFVLKGNVFVNVKNYDWSKYTGFVLESETANLVEQAMSFLNYNPSAVKYVFKGSVPDSVRQALEAAGIIVEVVP